QLVEMVRLAEADATSGVAERRIERRAGVHDGAAVLEQHLAREDAGPRPLLRGALEGGGEPRLRHRVVVQQQHPVRSALERAADAGAAAARETAVPVQTQQLDVA